MTGLHGDPESALALAELDRKVMELKAVHRKTFRQIGQELGISKSYAYDSFKRGMHRIDEEIAELGRRYLYEHLAECQADRAAVLDVLNGDHIVVSNGQIVRLDGQPLEDSAPVLAAVDRMLKIRDQEAGYLGLKAKIEVNHSGGVTYDIVGVDMSKLT